MVAGQGVGVQGEGWYLGPSLERLPKEGKVNKPKTPEAQGSAPLGHPGFQYYWKLVSCRGSSPRQEVGGLLLWSCEVAHTLL